MGEAVPIGGYELFSKISKSPDPDAPCRGLQWQELRHPEVDDGALTLEVPGGIEPP